MYIVSYASYFLFSNLPQMTDKIQVFIRLFICIYFDFLVLLFEMHCMLVGYVHIYSS